MIARISKGTNMDQIYLPKNRAELPTGGYVMITPLDEKPDEEEAKLFFYNVKNLEPIKIEIIKKIFHTLSKLKPENLIVTGSFLERGFKFNDIDVLLIKEDETNAKKREEYLQTALGIRIHLIQMSNKALLEGISSDPIYSMMLSRFVSKNRAIFNAKRRINYKILDLQLLKSRTLIDNYEILNGEEKYYLTLNMVSILLFIEGKMLSKDIVDKEIEKIFKIKVKEIKNNMVGKNFLGRYKKVYNHIFSKIMENVG